MNKRLILSLSITIGFLILSLIPTIESLNLGFIEIISMWIHWPLFAIGFFREPVAGSFLFVAIWYGILTALGTSLIYFTLQAVTDKG